MLQLQEIKMAKGLPVDLHTNAGASGGGKSHQLTKPDSLLPSALGQHHHHVSGSGVNDDVFPGQPPAFYHSLSSSGEHLPPHSDRRKDAMTKRSFSLDVDLSAAAAKNHYSDNKDLPYRNHGYSGVGDAADMVYQLHKAGGSGRSARSGPPPSHPGTSAYYNAAAAAAAAASDA